MPWRRSSSPAPTSAVRTPTRCAATSRSPSPYAERCRLTGGCSHGCGTLPGPRSGDRESGGNPELSRNCQRGAAGHRSLGCKPWEDGRAALIREPGDLRRSGTTVSPRETGGGSLTRRGPHRRGTPRREENLDATPDCSGQRDSDRQRTHARSGRLGCLGGHPPDIARECRPQVPLLPRAHRRQARVGEPATAFPQRLAVLADLAAGHALPAQATGWLTCAQRRDGGFGYVINDATSSPPTFCGDASSDTNDSAIILEALGAAGITSANSAAGTYLHSAQQTNGGFGFTGAGPSDPDSDAGVIQALVAIAQDPTGAPWTVTGGGNPMTDMETFADPNGSGGYVFPGNTSPDAFTTSGVPQALVLKPYAAATTVVAGTAPPPAVTATPSPTPTPIGGISTPPTGAYGGTAGGSILPLALLGLGALALGAASLRRRTSPIPGGPAAVRPSGR